MIQAGYMKKIQNKCDMNNRKVFLQVIHYFAVVFLHSSVFSSKKGSKLKSRLLWSNLLLVENLPFVIELPLEEPKDFPKLFWIDRV